MSTETARDPKSIVDSDAGKMPTKLKVLSLEVSRDRLWFWGLRSGLSLCDQALVSGSTFLLNVMLARWLIKEAYGAFAVCYAAFLFLSGFHNVLVVEPMTVIGPSSYSDRLVEYMGSQLRTHLIIVGPLFLAALLSGVGLAFFNIERVLVPAVLALAFCLPLILLLYLVRRMCYVLQNPLVAVQASALYCLILLPGAIGLHHFGYLTPATAFVLVAVASLLSSVFILRRLSLSSSLLLRGGSLSLVEMLRQNWSYGHWLVLITALSWLLIQAQTFLTAGFLELSAAGALRAMQLPSLVISQLMAAMALLLLPSMSHELGRGDLDRLHQKAILSTIALSVFGLAFAAILYFFYGPVENLLFGGKYASSAWLIPVLALAPVFTGTATSLSLALRTLRKTKFEVFAYLLSGGMALVLGLVFIPRWGLPGVAVSIVGSTATHLLGIAFCYLRFARKTEVPQLSEILT
jgi:O-antigen/teichoic acid export membrane protein